MTAEKKVVMCGSVARISISPLSISIYLSVCLSINHSINQSIYLSLSIYLYLFLSLSISIYLSPSVSIYLILSLSISIYLPLSISTSISFFFPISIYPSICRLSISPSVCLSAEKARDFAGWPGQVASIRVRRCFKQRLVPGNAGLTPKNVANEGEMRFWRTGLNGNNPISSSHNRNCTSHPRKKKCAGPGQSLDTWDDPGRVSFAPKTTTNESVIQKYGDRQFPSCTLLNLTKCKI